MAKTKQLVSAIALACASKAALALPYLDGSVAIGAAGAITKSASNTFINAATRVGFADANHDGNGDLKVTSSDGIFASLGFNSGLGSYIVGTQWSFADPVFGFAGAASAFKFFADDLTKLGQILNPRNHTLTIYGSGHWHDASGRYADTEGDYTLSFTQSGPSTSSMISFSGTFSAYHVDTTFPDFGLPDGLAGDNSGGTSHVPEPSAALLVMLGLAGLCARRRIARA